MLKAMKSKALGAMRKRGFGALGRVVSDRLRTDGVKKLVGMGCVIESLERRELMSVTTILTHGFALESAPNMPVWLAAMGEAVADRYADAANATQAGVVVEGKDIPQFKMTIDYLNGGGIGVTDWSFTDSFAGDGLDAGSYSLADHDGLNVNGDMVVVLDWTSVAGLATFPIFAEASTQEVAEIVFDKLMDGSLAVGEQILQSSIHLGGHSRGASLMGALAEDLGGIGLMVDHLTYLDPHPVDWAFNDADWGENGSDDIGVPGNVVFADNYWRPDTGGGDDGPEGEPADGALNVEMSNAGFDEVGYGGVSDLHSDVHLWYYGTVNTEVNPLTNGDTDEVLAIDLSSAQGQLWYGGEPGARDEVGFNIAKLGGQTVIRDADELKAGLGTGFGGDGIREVMVLDGDDAWANVNEVKLVGTEMGANGAHVVLACDGLRVGFSYLDADSELSVRVVLDDDLNIFNGDTGIELGQFDYASSLNINTVEVELDVTDVMSGRYFIRVIADDGVRVRSDYFYEPIDLFVPRLDGDFNEDGMLNAADIDLLGRNLFTQDLTFDLNCSGGFIDVQDLKILIDDLLVIPRGDANLDKVVNLEDLARLATNFGQSGKGWAEGDFTFDGNVDLADLAQLATNFGLKLNAQGGEGAGSMGGELRGEALLVLNEDRDQRGGGLEWDHIKGVLGEDEWVEVV